MKKKTKKTKKSKSAKKPSAKRSTSAKFAAFKKSRRGRKASRAAKGYSARKARRKSSGSSSGGSITSQVSSYKDEAIGGLAFGLASNTKIFDLVKVSPNPAARELVGAVALHFLGNALSGEPRKYLKDAAKAGVSYSAILLAKNSDVAKSISAQVDPMLPAQPFNDKFLLE